MPRDPRRFKGRASVGIDLGGLTGGDTGGGVELDDQAIADVASEVPFSDSSFDANNVLRYKPVSGIKNFLSGGKATAIADELNQQAQYTEVQNRMTQQNADTLFGRQKELEGIRAGNDVNLQGIRHKNILEQSKFNTDEALRQNKVLQDRNIARLAATLAGEAEPDMLYLPDDPDIPAIYQQQANDQLSNYGNQLGSYGIKGAPAQLAHTEALTSNLNKPAEKKINRTDLKDGTGFIDHDNNTVTRLVYDPTDPNKPPQVFVTSLDTGITVRKKASVDGNGSATTSTQAAKPVVSGIKGKGIADTIKNVIDYGGHLDSDIDWNALNPFTPSTDVIQKRNAEAPRFNPQNIPQYNPAPVEDVEDAIKQYLQIEGTKPAEGKKKKQSPFITPIRRNTN